MNALENVAMLKPEKLAMLKRVFDEICLEATIPVEAAAERNALADPPPLKWYRHGTNFLGV
jgi:hypothetical protein